MAKMFPAEKKTQVRAQGAPGDDFFKCRPSCSFRGKSKSENILRETESRL